MWVRDMELPYQFPYENLGKISEICYVIVSFKGLMFFKCKIFFEPVNSYINVLFQKDLMLFLV